MQENTLSGKTSSEKIFVREKFSRGKVTKFWPISLILSHKQFFFLIWEKLVKISSFFVEIFPDKVNKMFDLFYAERLSRPRFLYFSVFSRAFPNEQLSLAIVQIDHFKMLKRSYDFSNYKTFLWYNWTQKV